MPYPILGNQSNKMFATVKKFPSAIVKLTCTLLIVYKCQICWAAFIWSQVYISSQCSKKCKRSLQFVTCHCTAVMGWVPSEKVQGLKTITSSRTSASLLRISSGRLWNVGTLKNKTEVMLKACTAAHFYK